MNEYKVETIRKKEAEREDKGKKRYAIQIEGKRKIRREAVITERVGEDGKK